MDKRVVLVYPYFQAKDPVAKLFQPLGIAYLAGQLKEQSIEVSVVDCTFETPASAVAKIVSLNPAIVGFSVMVSLSRNAFDIALQLQSALPGALLIAGGPLPTVYPQRYLSYFDIVFQGESDFIFPRFCRDYLASSNVFDFRKRLDVNTYPGLSINTPLGIASSQPVHHNTPEINNLPLPDRNGFRHDLYQKHWYANEQARPTTIIITRGCPYNCDFCSKPVWGNVYRQTDLNKVFLEINDIVALGYDRLWIADDCFTLDLAYLREFCRQKLLRGIDIKWTCLSRTRGMDQKTVELMKEAGCVKVYLGLESGSDVTLRLMGKKSTVQKGIKAVTIFTRAGISAAGFFIVGYPGETIESIEKTLSFSLSIPLDEISINVPLPIPGSALYERVCRRNPDDDWEKASSGRFVYKSEFDQDWLQGRIKETLARFKVCK
jgi:anaerobic magnesium-protoporphyrin IX monomethyl ester cyclase